MTDTEKHRVIVDTPPTREVRAKIVTAKNPGPHSPEIQKMLDQPLVSAADIKAMTPKERAEAEKRGLIKRPPVEVWLTKKNIEITCRVVAEDESVSELQVDSLSMRGAQREMTGYFKSRGYEPVGRWEQEFLGDDAPDDADETFRRFR